MIAESSAVKPTDMGEPRDMGEPNDMGRFAHGSSTSADWYSVRNTISKPLRALFVGAALLLALAACGGGDEADNALSMLDNQVETDGTSSGEPSTSKLTTKDDDGTGNTDGTDRPALPEQVAPAASSADRQEQQVVGAGPSPGAPDSGVDEADITNEPNITSRESAGDAPAQDRITPGEAAAAEAAANGIVQRDLQLPDAALRSSTLPDFEYDEPVVRGPLDPRVQAEIGATSVYGCQPGVDAECSEVEPPPDGLVVAEEEPVEPPPAVPEGADDICPPGSAASCTETPIDPVAPDTGDDGGNVGGERRTEVVSDCDARPWARGCDGPAPDPEDLAGGIIDDDDDDSSQDGETDDDAEQNTGGVDVPQEVQDILLTPPPDKDSPNTPPTDDGTTDDESPGGDDSSTDEDPDGVTGPTFEDKDDN